MKFERRHQPVAPRKVFRSRLLRSLALGGQVLGISLAVGVAGYHWLVGLDWLDALLNASMILGGMGPVDPVTRTGGKWFASVYALYSGVALLTSVGVIFAPVLHRVLHVFHAETEEQEEKQDNEGRPEKTRPKR
ncbi:MAG TPA: hypothetical protein VJY35_04130 [Candidatus Eisenbacteria bacterium]|nr:hypothetical protein [Candidatus Eisenbacteria bacterium]